MDLDQTVMVAGIGCRSGVRAEEVEAALAAALRQNAPRGIKLTLIATAAAKRGEPALMAVAKARGVPLVLIHPPALEAANAKTLTHSDRSMAAMNVHSVAEAAALAGAEVATRGNTREAARADGARTDPVLPQAVPPDIAQARGAPHSIAPHPIAPHPIAPHPTAPVSRTDPTTFPRLLAPRIAVGPVTCALAIADMKQAETS